MTGDAGHLGYSWGFSSPEIEADCTVESRPDRIMH